MAISSLNTRYDKYWEMVELGAEQVARFQKYHLKPETLAASSKRKTEAKLGVDPKRLVRQPIEAGGSAQRAKLSKRFEGFHWHQRIFSAKRIFAICLAAPRARKTTRCSSTLLNLLRDHPSVAFGALRAI